MPATAPDDSLNTFTKLHLLSYDSLRKLQKSFFRPVEQIKLNQ